MTTYLRELELLAAKIVLRINSNRQLDCAYTVEDQKNDVLSLLEERDAEARCNARNIEKGQA